MKKNKINEEIKSNRGFVDQTFHFKCLNSSPEDKLHSKQFVYLQSCPKFIKQGKPKVLEWGIVQLATSVKILFINHGF